RFVGDAVELEIREPQAGFFGGAAEFPVLREANAVRRALHAEVTDLAGVRDGAQEMGGERGLAAGELDGQLPSRLDGERVIEDLLDLAPLELVDVADLVRVHEARIAHHVAAVREIDGKNGSASVFHAGASVIAKLGI